MEHTSRLLYKTIFVALDGSEHQDFVLARAAAIAKAYHAHLVIGHVVDSTTLETAST